MLRKVLVLCLRESGQGGSGLPTGCVRHLSRDEYGCRDGQGEDEQAPHDSAAPFDPLKTASSSSPQGARKRWPCDRLRGRGAHDICGLLEQGKRPGAISLLRPPFVLSTGEVCLVRLARRPRSEANFNTARRLFIVPA